MAKPEVKLPPVNLINFNRLRFWKKEMMTIDEIVGRMVQLEQELLELRLEHLELKAQYKKDTDEAYRSGYRDGSFSLKDSLSGH